jgi:glycosyltransferase involved in cell wall biosynthesis
MMNYNNIANTKKKICVVSSSIYMSRRATIYGSEVETFLLAEQLGKMGNDVYFYGASGSERSPYFKKFRYIHSQQSTISYDDEYSVIQYYSDELADCDVIVDASSLLQVAEWAYWWGNKPFIAVRNGTDINAPRLFKYRNIVVLSSLVQSLNPGTRLKIIPYGVDEDFYTLNENIEDRYYYLYLARPTPTKGIFQFLEIAKRMPDEQFKLSFSMPSEEHQYYGEQILEVLPNNVEYVNGDSDFEGTIKLDLFQHAKALISPLQSYYKEAFGLNLCEAMITGTNFITNGNSISTDLWAGSNAVLTDGTTKSYVYALKHYQVPDPAKVRKYAVAKYSKEVMANNYMFLINAVIAGEKW